MPDGPDGVALKLGNDPMKQKFLALSLGLGAMLLATQHAFAQGSNCAARDTVVERLADGYGETRQSIGLAPNNSVVEVFASLETGTWTITVTNPSGITCLVASGQSYESTDEDLTPAKGTAL
jgi:hypothetical protein